MTKRLKLFVIIGRDRGSFEDNRVGALGSSRFLGLRAVGPEAESCANGTKTWIKGVEGSWIWQQATKR